MRVFLISIDIPGVEEENIEIHLENRILSIEAEGKSHEDSSSFKRSYAQSLRLPKDVDEENLEAQYLNGVLELKVPKAEAATKKRIPLTPKKESFFKKLISSPTKETDS